MQKALDGIGKDGAGERTSDERVTRDSNGVAVVLPLLFSRSIAILVEPLACSGGEDSLHCLQGSAGTGLEDII